VGAEGPILALTDSGTSLATQAGVHWQKEGGSGQNGEHQRAWMESVGLKGNEIADCDHSFLVPAVNGVHIAPCQREQGVEGRHQNGGGGGGGGGAGSCFGAGGFSRPGPRNGPGRRICWMRSQELW